VVAVGEMGTADVMQGDNGGFMVRDDAAEFAEKVNLLLEDEELYRKKSAEGLLWGEKWKISSLTPRLVECYEEARRISRGNR
jgi:glycosyltransferase involved in cell wall biosynthesis